MRRCILKDDAASFAACSLIRTLAKRSVLASSPRAFILSSLHARLGLFLFFSSGVFTPQSPLSGNPGSDLVDYCKRSVLTSSPRAFYTLVLVSQAGVVFFGITCVRSDESKRWDEKSRSELTHVNDTICRFVLYTPFQLAHHAPFILSILSTRLGLFFWHYIYEIGRE